ncbi:hypothetical protein [Lysinibacillus xylanilyticus]|uniref:hypothetical protein n=1 Tax=Lysinibacillus xylanilyticus TaxID=582475 RepID=UPI003CFD9F17
MKVIKEILMIIPITLLLIGCTENEIESTSSKIEPFHSSCNIERGDIINEVSVNGIYPEASQVFEITVTNEKWIKYVKSHPTSMHPCEIIVSDFQDGEFSKGIIKINGQIPNLPETEFTSSK